MLLSLSKSNFILIQIEYSIQYAVNLIKLVWVYILEHTEEYIYGEDVIMINAGKHTKNQEARTILNYFVFYSHSQTGNLLFQSTLIPSATH